jgi:hypothetical protein
MGVKRNAYRLLARIKRPPRRPRSRWVDNIKMDLRQRGFPLNAENFLSDCTIGGFSRRAQLHE